MKLHKLAALTASALFTLSVQAATISGEDTKDVTVQFSSPVSIAFSLNAVENLVSGGSIMDNPLLATGNVTSTNSNPENQDFAVVKFNHTPITGFIGNENVIAATIQGDNPDMNPLIIVLQNNGAGSWVPLDLPELDNWAATPDANSNFKVAHFGSGYLPSPGIYTLSMTAAVYSG